MQCNKRKAKPTKHSERGVEETQVRLSDRTPSRWLSPDPWGKASMGDFVRCQLSKSHQVLPASSPGTKLLQAYPPLESSLCIVINTSGLCSLPKFLLERQQWGDIYLPLWGAARLREPRTSDICGPYAIPAVYPSLCSTGRNNELGELKGGSSHSILEEAYGFREMTVAQQTRDEIQRNPRDFWNDYITGLIASSVTHKQM